MSEISVNPVGEQVAHTEKEYALSTANVLDLSTLKAVFDWKIQDHVDLALRSGYQGVQLWPQRLKPLYQIRSGEITESEKKGILSAHQSARDSRPRT
ncbi:MAG TPA: hypothetical protein VG935_00620, partial [Patescibacteria group bacterium]|nr:hypothetical protein [Patescibacteria group bacterium]